MQAYSDKERESDPYALPDVEVFYMDADDFLHAYADTWMYDRMNEEQGGSMAEIAGALVGFYWWSCFPGCMPDSDPVGPFSSEAEALVDAQGREE